MESRKELPNTKARHEAYIGSEEDGKDHVDVPVVGNAVLELRDDEVGVDEQDCLQRTTIMWIKIQTSYK